MAVPRTDYNAVITATEHYLPEKVVTNKDLEKIVDTSDAWIRERTGIVERRFLEGKPTSHMATEVARRIIEARQLDMQASPYDMAGCGIEPIPVETVEGRNTYVARQRELREAAAPVRTALVTELAALETAIGDAAV